MDVEEYKKLARNKIEADALTRQVRDVIKTTKWQKQDVREGFKETFKPLIKSQDSIKKSIDEQQNATIAQLKKNQLALTQGFEQFNRLADMRELPYVGEDLDDYENEKGWDENWLPGYSSNKDRYLNLEKNFIGRDLDLLKEFGYPRPNDFFEINPKDLNLTLEELKGDIKQLTGEISGRKKAKNPSPLYETETEIKKIQKGTLIKYKNTMKDYLSSLKYKIGEGIYFNNPHQLLDRLELLGGSILAGNNGVINEFSHIAHLLNKMKVISKKQLNDLLKNYILNK